jgi:AcrR family transcriptional regulator
MIVATALPLVAEFGTAVTTAQIARAAGIGEATIFRAFADKDELLDACVTEALNPDHVVRELASISPDDPLPTRLTQAAEAMRAHLARLGAVLGTLHASGHGRGREPARRPTPDSRATSMRAVRDGVADLIGSDAESLRLDAATVASVFLGMLLTRPDQSAAADEPPLTAEELVHILLHGVLDEPGSPT